VRLINSSGIDVSFRSSTYAAAIGATLILDDGTRIDTGESRSWLAPASHTDLRKRIIDNITAAMTVKKIPGGKVPVVLTPRAFARLMGILTGGFNAKSVCKGISPFGDKRGETLFNRALTVRDDPLVAGSPYSYPFDDEGVTAAGKALVNRGTIETFITDLKHAQKLDLVPGGNGVRGYSSLPFPSFSNIIIEPGDLGRDELLRQAPRCVLVEQFIGLGQSNTITGDFSGNLELAYLVENGTITGRVKDCMLSDNLFSLLAGDIILSAERERSGSVLAPCIFFPAVNYTG
jgi:PmbA protein